MDIEEDQCPSQHYNIVQHMPLLSLVRSMPGDERGLGTNASGQSLVMAFKRKVLTVQLGVDAATATYVRRCVSVQREMNILYVNNLISFQGLLCVSSRHQSRILFYSTWTFQIELSSHFRRLM